MCVYTCVCVCMCICICIYMRRVGEVLLGKRAAHPQPYLPCPPDRLWAFVQVASIS